MIAQLLTSAVLAARLNVAPAPVPDTSLVVTTRWLAAHRADPDVIVIAVDRDDSGFRAGHIRGARFVSANGLDVDGAANTELASAAAVQEILEAVGVSDGSRVILTGHPLRVMRAFYALDFVGLARVSILAGGLPRWRAEGGPVETGASVAPARGHVTLHLRPVVATADYILERIGKPGMSLIDTRTLPEYYIAGHIPGAHRIPWQDGFTDPGEFTPRDLSELTRIWKKSVAPGDTVVTYCQMGMRASGTYFMARYLGYPVKLYDGSYEEWSRKHLPLAHWR